MMSKSHLAVVTDASNRAEKFRISLYPILDRHQPADPQDMMDKLSQAYALVGNLQMYLNEYRSEMIKLQNEGTLPE